MKLKILLITLLYLFITTLVYGQSPKGFEVCDHEHNPQKQGKYFCSEYALKQVGLFDVATPLDSSMVEKCFWNKPDQRVLCSWGSPSAIHICCCHIFESPVDRVLKVKIGKLTDDLPEFSGKQGGFRVIGNQLHIIFFREDRGPTTLVYEYSKTKKKLVLINSDRT